jgi:hypothetical protein
LNQAVDVLEAPLDRRPAVQRLLIRAQNDRTVGDRFGERLIGFFQLLDALKFCRLSFLTTSRSNNIFTDDLATHRSMRKGIQMPICFLDQV